MMRRYPFLLVCLCIAIMICFPSCATKMSLEEAKKVAITMDDTSFTQPSRRITDILLVLNQPGQFDDRVTRQLNAQSSKQPPDNADDRTMAQFFHARGGAALQQGHIKQALDDLRLALAYSEKAGLSDTALLRRLGVAEKVSGNFQKAVELFQRAMEIKDEMSTYYQLIDTYLQMGDLETVKTISRESFDAYRQKTMKKKSSFNPNREINMNRIMYSLLEAEGKYGEAEPYVRKELDLHRSQIDANPRAAIVSKMNLSVNLMRQHRLIEAEMEARQALKESLGLGGIESELTAKSVINLARIMLFQRRLGDAEQLAKAGIRILESSMIASDSNVMCNARMFLGNVLTQKEDFAEAMKQFDLAREGMKDNRFLYETKFIRNSNLILSLLKTNRGPEAMKIISGIYESNQSHYKGKHGQPLNVMGLRGMANAMAGNNRQAFRDFSAALPALMEQDGKNQDDGPNRFKHIVLEAYVDFLVRIYGTPVEKEIGINASDEAFRIVSYLSGQTTQTALGESSARAAAAYDPELADLVRKEQDMHKQIKALDAILSDAMMAPSDQQDAKALKTLRENVDQLAKARITILGEINKRFPHYAHFINPQPVTLDAVKKSLYRDEALISIFAVQNRTYIWTVPQNGEVHFSMASLGKKDLEQIVHKLRRSLDSNAETLGGIEAFDLEQAYHLYSKLLKPAERSWKGSKDLLISVNGSLGQLPLSLLPTEPVRLTDEKDVLFANYKQVPWLVRQVSITMLPSVNALTTLRSLPAADPDRKAFLGFGDPIFNREQLDMDKGPLTDVPMRKDRDASPEKVQLAGRGMKMHVRGIRITEKGNLDSQKIASSQLEKLDRLPDTAEELKSIAKALGSDPKQDVFLGKDCSKHRVLTMDMSNRKVIAFATHALVPGDLDGLDQPALALSSPVVTGDKEDGLLRMDEILKLKLSADWVVLSACNTGAAEGQGAEAVSGLGRAFFYAGTKALLVSMWPVETTSARKLVSGIFRFQRDDKMLSRAQILRKSILNLIDRDAMTDAATGRIAASYGHPIFWAPFVIVGDPGKHL
jgi:CHAT domain-containing protein